MESKKFLQEDATIGKTLFIAPKTGGGVEIVNEVKKALTGHGLFNGGHGRQTSRLVHSRALMDTPLRKTAENGKVHVFAL